ncbi:hypothetical protein HMPREF1210_02677 [Paenisporosarcina sp. HGH0030]|nr:hypothetical protein HMPREF1210_02677 [Paenisporosarcina sp. HGH0030]
MDKILKYSKTFVGDVFSGMSSLLYGFIFFGVIIFIITGILFGISLIRS